MPLLRRGVMMPVKGIDFSQPPTMIDQESGFPQNLRFTKAEFCKRPGKTVLGGRTADSLAIMGMGKLEMSSQVKYLVRASRTKIEKYRTATNDWENLKATDLTGGEDDHMAMTTVSESDLLILTNGVDKIQKWAGSGNAVDLGGTPPLAKYTTYVTPYLLIAHITDGANVYPWKVQWSDTDAPETWTGGNSGAALLSSDSSPIQNIAKLDEYVAVYKKESLWLGRKVDSEDIFIFERVKTGIGLASSRAFADARGIHYFMGANDFFAWNGVRIESIGRPVRDEVFSRINRDKIGRCFAIHVQETNEIWFFVVITGEDYPTEVWKYNYDLGFWYYDTCSNLTAAATWEKTSTLSWDEAVGTWDAQVNIWDSGTSALDWEQIALGDSSGYTYYVDYSTTNDNGTAVSSHLITKDFTGNANEESSRWLQLDFWGKGVGKLYVDYSTDFGDNWVNVPYTSSSIYVDLGSTYVKKEFYLDTWAEHIRFRFRNAVASENIYIRGFTPYYLGREEVRTYR